MRWWRLIAGLVLCLWGTERLTAAEIGRYKTLQLTFNSSEVPANPFDTYLLRLRVTDPDGVEYELDGFYDGDGSGGQEGRVWRARISPDKVGPWSWTTIPGDAPDAALAGRSGQFDVTESGDLGGLVSNGRYFQFDTGPHVYLVGNFLDFANGLRTTHTFMSETTSDADRDAIIDRQTGFHAANKANIYFANRKDYSSQSVTPWVGTSSTNDKSRMDITRWQSYDEHIQRFKDNEMLAELWFFADDSGFGSLAEADQQRLIRYGMARTSALSHTMYVLALEWQEGFSQQQVSDLGDYLQQHNPWQRPLSVHSLSDTNWDFGTDTWPTFVATQAGNGDDPDEVNAYGQTIRTQSALPHIDEEYGLLFSDSDQRLRGNLWANLTSGAAGGGTGSGLGTLQRFLAQSQLPFWEMEPDNSLVTDGGSTRFVLADSDHHYLVYSQTGSFTLQVSGTGLAGQWFDPRDPIADLGSPFAVTPGSPLFTPPSDTNEDWVLWISDGTGLGESVTHPSSGAQIVNIQVPEPSTGLLGGVALLLLLLRTRRDRSVA